MTSGLRAPKVANGELRPPEPRSERCLNCGAPLAGAFCAQCGQRDIPPYPNIRELVTDAFWELSGWDGRFAATVRALIAAPGKLTTEFLGGRRVRYVSPLRLYLVASLGYFLVAAAAPELRPSGAVNAAGVNIAVSGTAPSRVAGAAREAREGELTPGERASTLKDIGRAPPLLRPVLVRAVTDPQGFRRGLLQTMPRVLFALVPVFAAILALFFRRRKFPEHLYFSLHLHAFVFVALTASEASKLPRVFQLAEVVGALVALWIAVYAVVALRSVYRESLARTLAKSIGIGGLYALAGAAAMAGTVYWAALFG